MTKRVCLHVLVLFFFLANTLAYADSSWNDSTPTPLPNWKTAPYTVLFYNPNGGTKYHLSQYCKSVKDELLPMQGIFYYSEINDYPYRNMAPCAACGAPLRTGSAPASEIESSYSSLNNTIFRQKVEPMFYDTQFSEEEGSTNPGAKRKLSHLNDNNLNTSFSYTIWYSERQDNYAEVYGFFDNVQISNFCIINGDVTSCEAYNKVARAHEIMIRLYCNSGVYYINLDIPDTYSKEFQVFSLGNTFYDVYQVDVLINSFYQGQDKTKYEMHVTEMAFY